MSRLQTRRARVESRSPYPGIRPFRRDESLFFLGREDQIESLLSPLEAGRFLAIVGTSGSGKSSLVKAGLIPSLEAGKLGQAGSRWYIADMHPGNSPLVNLAREILRCGILGPDWPNDEANFEVSLGLLLPRLRVGPRGLIELLRSVEIPPLTNLLIVADQFEEIFRFYKEQNANDALRFVNLLMATAADRSVSAYVVLTMRSDHLGECALFPDLPKLLNNSQFLCPRLTREQIGEAILLPPKLLQRGEVQPELASQIIQDVGANSDQLPLIQHCLARMWHRAEAPSGPRTLTLDQYLSDQTGATATEPAVPAVFASVNHHAEEILKGFTEPDALRVVECVFRALATRGPSGQMVRRSVSLRQLAEESSPSPAPADVERVQAQVVRIVDAFRADGHNFLMPSVKETPTLMPETMIDVSHEAVLRQWKQVDVWLQAEAKAAAELRNLVHEAGRWQEKKDKDLLLRKLRLAQMQDWQAKLPSQQWPLRYVSKLEYELAIQFLHESAENKKLEDAAEESRRLKERELEIENRTLAEKNLRNEAERKQKEAEQTRQRAEEKRRSADLKMRRWRKIAFGAGFAAFLLFIVVIWAWRQRSKAVTAKEEADIAKNDAIKAKDDAVEAKNLAKKAEDDAVELEKNQTRMADVFRMLSLARDGMDTTPLQSGLLSVEAVRLAQKVTKNEQIMADATDSFAPRFPKSAVSAYPRIRVPLKKSPCTKIRRAT